ncbi:hypothetical protein [Priestia flexa]|uniref:hypothetical protein n=1 Tax=Priestia flexa TaxID=86664 RepID=UPI00099D857E|nr:hypothetical protein [Priestia flexa]AQX56033.1 hypothetical protein BC359_18130 [Priestia flexa]
MAKNVYTKGNHYTKEQIQPAIVEFIQQKGGEVSHEDISDFVFAKFGIRFGNFSDVMAGVRDFDKRVVKGRRGYSKLIPEAKADCE